tara:strand:+ start:1015 stop:1389 length:375 start_codon:yes stop_codon:yes gene_type:complete
MYVLLLIILVILLIEIYSLIPDRKNYIIDDKINVTNETNAKTKDKINTTKEINFKFNEYLTKEGINVFHSPGKILIKDNYNIILKYNDENILMEKDSIYTINDNFEIEIINVNNNDIIYYYISS